MKKKLHIFATALVAAGLSSLAPGTMAQTTVNGFAPFSATPAAGVWYESDVRIGGAASVVNLTGAGGDLESNQPLPIGAAKLTTDLTNAAKAEVSVPNTFGVVNDILANFKVGYSWYKASNAGQNPNAAPSLKLTFFNPLCDQTAGGDCFATLVYEPYTNGFGNFPPQDAWQRSDLDKDTGTWWTTGGFGFGNGFGGCPCFTLAGWVANSTPDFGQATLVAVTVGVGTFNPGQIGYFDDVTIEGTLADAEYDFDPAPPFIPHDVDATLGVGNDIGLGAAGTKIVDVKAACKNETAAENVRCTVQVSGLPPGCTTQSSGPDKAFGTGDDGLPISSGGFLVDSISAYGVNQTKHFDFKLKTTCSPNLAKGVVAILKFKACADGGNIDLNEPCEDIDLTPDASPNVVVKSVKLHR